MGIKQFVAGMAGAAFLASAAQAADAPPKVETTAAANKSVSTVISVPSVKAGNLDNYFPQVQKAIDDSNNNLPKAQQVKEGDAGFDLKVAQSDMQRRIVLAAIHSLNPVVTRKILHGEITDLSDTGDKNVDAFLRGKKTVHLKTLDSMPLMAEPIEYIGRYSGEGVKAGWVMQSKFESADVKLEPLSPNGPKRFKLTDDSTISGLKITVHQVDDADKLIFRAQNSLDRVYSGRAPQTLSIGAPSLDH